MTCPPIGWRDRQRPVGRGWKLTATGVALLVIGTVGGAATFSAFKGTTDSPTNTFTAGTVTIEDNDNGVRMFNVTNMVPGQTKTQCINVQYTGSVPAEVRLYASSTAGALDAYLDVRVRRGGATGTFPACGTFTSDGDIDRTETVTTLPSTWATGIVGADTTWNTGESHAYEFAVTLKNTAGAAQEGQSSSPITFTWEAQNK